MKVKKLSEMTKFFDNTIPRILHDHLSVHKVSSRWISTFALTVLDLFRNCVELKWTLWWKPLSSAMILYYEPSPKREYNGAVRVNPQWKFKFYQSTKKMTSTIFCDREGILLIEFKETNTTINGIYYVALLHKLRQSIRNKRRGILTRGVWFLHVHTSDVAQTVILYNGFQQIDHLTHSTDMAPNNYYFLIISKRTFAGVVTIILISLWSIKISIKPEFTQKAVTVNLANLKHFIGGQLFQW